MSETWDGKPVAADPPFGATVIVYRVTPFGTEFLILHRAHAGPDFEGDWAWTPPAGARYPSESLEDCAHRELGEETGLSGALRRLDSGPAEWAIFLVEVSDSSEVVLHDTEHDRFDWVSLSDAAARCRPERAAIGFALASRVLDPQSPTDRNV
jgi:8-oxo-dGTP pyrophosphatase MutT (NUDIX family)